MGISSSGVGSGLDVNAIVTQLMAAESKPLTILQQQESSYKSKLSAYGTLKSTLSNFQTALKGLNGSAFNAQTATASNTDILSATAGSSATPGTYAIQVTQLAQQQKLTSAGVADSSASLGTGSLTIKVGNADAITIPGTGTASYTLQSLRDAINASGAAVSATIVNDGSAAGNRLVLTAKDTGAVNTIKITGSGALAQFSYDPASPVVYDPANPTTGMSQLQAAKDAKLTIDGIPVTKSSNTITDAIQGVTLKLTKETAGSAITLTVARDTATVKSSIESFVKAYNDLSGKIKTMTAYDPTTKTGGALQGDSGAKSVLTQIRGALGEAVDDAGSLRLLSDIGVTFQKDGTLAIDDKKLQKAMDGKFDDIAKLFSSSTGYATRLIKLADDMLGEKGIITTRTDGLNASIKNLTDREDDMQARLDAVEKRYRAQFTALDAALASMQNTSAYLSQQLAAIAKNS
ncbi:flagellar filament capping protein FliD [Noviherbaspirillum massiliense]|uniref:flagellar filament capping protein FliD n=1 Tax=Noviherbaspirillum massiliense TaxID=1465823 RepID=UPI0002F0F51D|nr:flagellar filament capping protein FliD [Noviherbaspirillum massiliense]